MYYVNNDYLAHIGNENSGRYKKGSGLRPRATRKGGPLYATWLRKHKKENKTPEVEKLRKPTEKQLMEIINSGDAQKVYQYRRFMSTNDLNAAKNRINAEDEMRKLAEKQIETGLDKFDRYSDKWDRVTKDIEKFGQGYDRIAKVYNVFADDNAKLPTFKTPSSKLKNLKDNNGDNNKQKVKNKQKVSKIPTLEGWKKDANDGDDEAETERTGASTKTYNVETVNIDKRTTVNMPEQPSVMKKRTVKTKKDGTRIETIKYRKESGKKTPPTEKNTTKGKKKKKKDKNNG